MLLRQTSVLAHLFVFFLLMATALPSVAQGEGQGADSIGLGGSDWFIHSQDPSDDARATWAMADTADEGWVAARVPGNIQADLEAARRLTPHWYGPGDDRIWGVAEQAWWYRKDVEVPASYAGRRLTLVFNGVDPMCEVYVNGSKVGEASGMYRRLRFDVTEVIRPGQTNRIAVRIPAIPEGLTDYHRLADRTSPLQSTDAQGRDYFPNGINRVRQVLQDLKSPTNFGWDWGVCIWTMGIWKDAALEATGPARIDWTQVQTTLNPTYDRAQVTLGLDINTTDALAVRAVVQLIGPNAPSAVEHEQALTPGENHLQLHVTVDSPALWWPNGQGEQPLYTAQITLYDVATGDVLDRRRQRFGIREVRWEQVEGAPADFINPYQLVVNGRPVRMMGSNLIPPDLMFGRIMERGPLLLHRAHAVGMNTLRVWGGGVILPEAMYDLADELGIMLSQEFPLANAWPETDDVFLGNLETTVTSIVKQTRNHPSIIEWSGGNEMPWQQGTEHAALQVLERVVAEHDNRLFRATCPIQGSYPHGPWTFDPDNQGTALRYNAGYAHYNALTHMRHGEFGAPSPTNLDTWYRTVPPALHDVENHLDHRIIRRKKVAYAVFAPNLWLNLPQIEHYFGPADGLPMTVAAGQFLGAEGLRYAMDSHRQRGGRVGGFMSWNFNEPWPNGAGSYMIDYSGQPLMNYDFVRQALAPVALSLRHDGMTYSREAGINARLMLVSDAAEPHAGLVWRWTVRDRRGAVVASRQGSADLAPRQVLELDTIAVIPPAKTALGPFFVELSLTNAQGQRLGDRLHVFVCDETRAGLRGMLRQDIEDADDDAQPETHPAQDPTRPQNLAYTGNGAKPATASSAHALAYHRPEGLNDGAYGNESAWIAAEDGATFTIELAQTATINEVRLGRDRTHRYTDRAVARLWIEASIDGQEWTTAAQIDDLTQLPGFGRLPGLHVAFPGIEARLVRVTVYAAQGTGVTAIDEFEVYAHEPQADEPDTVRAEYVGPPLLYRPVARAEVTVHAGNYRIVEGREQLTLTLHNAGPMTALLCNIRPVLADRTDLFIDHNNLSVPPGESRTLTLNAAHRPGQALTLDQLGWRVTPWNAPAVSIPPAASVLLAVGRADRMCMEFEGAIDAAQRDAMPAWAGIHRPINADQIPYRLSGGGPSLELAFEREPDAGQEAVELILHTADRSAEAEVVVEVEVNGHTFYTALPAGYGLQDQSPEHLASPAAVHLPIPADAVRPGDNTLTLRVRGGGWLTWDAIHAVAVRQP
ncbi:MAG: glycosyl hydrolase 2 galactose-binding domain-containing protein [Phycisphaerales bacterium JB063]